MAVLTHHPSRGLILVEAGIRDRLSARLRARALDAELAAGAPPESTTRLALRADTITRPAMRRDLARSLERILTASARPAGLHPTPASLGRRHVIANAADGLEALITRLRDPGPVAARGCAQVIALICDGAGPLHLGTTEPDLPTAIRQTLTHLDDPGQSSPSPSARRRRRRGHRPGP